MNGAERYERFLLVVDEDIDDRCKTGMLVRQFGFAMLAAAMLAGR